MQNWMRFSLGLTAGFSTFAVTALLIDARREAVSMPEYWPAPAFELVDQEGDSLRTTDLLGSVWIASFIFTNCADVCPGITARMARLGEDLRGEGVLGSGVRLVSFTVDPERDTPDVLREYAAGFGGLDPSQWVFLTGTEPDSVREMIQSGFHLTAMKPDYEPPHGDAGSGSGHAGEADAASYQVMHAPRVLLVDRHGTIRGIYDATNPESMNAVLDDALDLLED